MWTQRTAMSSEQSMDDTGRWLEADTEATDASPKAAAKVLTAIASTLEQAPEDRRYDIQLVVEERSVDTDTDH